jgi:hypothetical protein
VPTVCSFRSRSTCRLLLLGGYALLENVAMPIIGDPETVNNTYLQQIVADAKAAIDKASEMGVTDVRVLLSAGAVTELS